MPAAETAKGVLVAGEINVDLICQGYHAFPTPGREVLVDDFKMVLGSASAIWYGIVTIVAYRVWRDFTVVRERLLTLSRDSALVAALVVVVLLAGWLLYRRRRKP